MPDPPQRNGNDQAADDQNPVQPKEAKSPGLDPMGHTVEFEPTEPAIAGANRPDGLPSSFGRYTVQRLIGKGGFGVVYEGRDEQLCRAVAIKVPIIKPGRDVEEQFLQEARRLAQLQHPGIVAIHDIGIQDGCCFIISDLIEGMSLKDWLKDNKPSWQQAARIVAAVADALAHAHAQSTVHRDIKPDNIIVNEGPNGIVPRLIDFGLALNDSDETGQQRGIIAGTPAYMSPEQAQGLAHRVDGRTDIYSLGVLLYRMLVGRVPFRSSDVRELLRQICEDSPQPPRQLVQGIPPELESVCFKALAKKESKRFTTAGDLAAALHRTLEVGSSQAGAGVSAEEVPLQSIEVDSDVVTRSSLRRRREAERRQLTVMICNCETADPDAPLEMLDLEDQHDALSSFHNLCEEVVHQFDGAVAQSTGQELMVCFGFPVAHEDAPQRAIRTALGVLDEMKRLNARLKGVDLDAWFSIHTGMAVAEETGAPTIESTDTLAIVGEARNVASRIEQFAKPGQVIISASTHSLVDGYFTFEDCGDQTVRGISKPMKIYSVLEPIAVRSRVELADSENLSPLIGRDTELSILKDRWEHAAEGMGQVVLLIGDAGLGKSRLIREIKDHIANEDPDSQLPVIEWRCSSYHTSSGLFAPTDFFERLLGFTREDSPAARLDKLVEHLECVNLAGQEQNALFASLLSIPPDARCAPLAFTPQRQKELTQQLLLDWLREYSANRPMLFIVEDLHWVDHSTQEFLQLHVGQGLHDGVLTVLTFRPEFKTPWQSYAHQTQVALNRLTKRQIGQMMKQKTNTDIPDDIVAQVVERTDGVPLFVEEFTKVIEESGALTNGGSINLDAIPTSLQDLLLARLDRMASNPDVVQMGATLGREFTYELLNAVLEIVEAELQDELNKLVDAELLFQKGRPPKCTYIFKHALIQDAAYNSLLKKKRQQFHQQIGDTMESQFPEMVDTQPDLLAQHFTDAGDVAKAINFWLKAGQLSQHRSANVEAISQFQKCLELLLATDESPIRDMQELGARLPLSASLMGVRGYANPDVQVQNQRARELCEKLGEGAPLFPVMMVIWAIAFILGKIKDAEEHVAELIALGDASGDDGAKTEAHWAAECTAYWRGDFRKARDFGEQADLLYQVEPAVKMAQFTQQNSGPLLKAYAALSLAQLGLIEQAQAKMDEALALADQLNHPFTTAVTWWKQAFLYELIDDRENALMWAEKVLKISLDNAFAFWTAFGMCAKGAALNQKGQNAEAIPVLKEGIRTMEMTGCQKGLQNYYGHLADAFWNNAQPTEAWAALDIAFEINDRDEERFVEAELYRRKGEFLSMDAAKIDAAITTLERAIEIAKRQESKLFELRATNRLCRILQQQQRSSDARGLLTRIRGSFADGLDCPDVVEADSLIELLSNE